MFGECVVILVIILAIMLMSLKMSKKNAALESLPIIFVPLMYIIANYVSGPLASILPVNKFSTYSGFVVLGIIVSSMLVGMFANRYKRKSFRALYITAVLVFDIVLGIVLITNI